MTPAHPILFGFVIGLVVGIFVFGVAFFHWSEFNEFLAWRVREEKRKKGEGPMEQLARVEKEWK
jgi:hypothetical protein